MDKIAYNREIIAPRKRGGQFDRHAEEDLANHFLSVVKTKGMRPEDVRGTLYIHQSNPTGFCGACIQGIKNPNANPGVLKQLSIKFPNLRIEGTTEVVEGVKAANGSRWDFTLVNGKFVN